MKTLYKILLEVKLLHEFYLTDPQGNSVFDLPNQPDRLNFLAGRFNQDFSPINEIVEFDLPGEQQLFFRNQRLALVPSYSGFQIAIEVSELPQPDGSVYYSPLVPFADSANLLVGIRERSGVMDQICNRRLAREVQGIRYFSNEKNPDPKTFPVLSAPVAAYDGTRNYEQGELAAFGPGLIKAYYYYDIGNPLNKDHWTTVAGDGYSSEADRMLVMPRFSYRFLLPDQVTQPVFELRDGNGNLVDSRAFNSIVPFNTLTLDYSNLVNTAAVKALPADGAGSGLVYYLNVSGDNGYSRRWPLIFYNPASDEIPGDHWGYIQLQNRVSNPAYNMLDGSARLAVHKNPDGTYTDHPVWEIRLKSRYSYWRYRNDAGGTLQAPAADIAVFLDQVNGQWVSKSPRFQTYLPQFFYNSGDNSYHYLPNPFFESVPEMKGRQWFSNIPVPVSALFPVN